MRSLRAWLSGFDCGGGVVIRSTYEYQHTIWKTKASQYSFCGMRLDDMSEDELRAALAFMVQYAGDLSNRLNNGGEQ